MSPVKQVVTTKVTGTPEDCLRRAMEAKSSSSRARAARQGLAARGPLDATTHAMLLRQLYLSLFEQRRFEEALDVARQAIDLHVLVDVLHQDAARAALGAHDVDGAVQHLRAAARRGPPSRRPFHLWTLGSVLYVAGRFREAASALRRASRWGTKEKPLYRAHLALAQLAAGEAPDDLREVVESLAQAPCGQGYGRFVLGHLAYALGEWEASRKYLRSFVRRTSAARPTMAIALEAELAMARTTLGRMARN